MRIGLVRHYKVKHGFPRGFLSPDELMTWFRDYDESDVEMTGTDLQGINWSRCYVSSMDRAVKTARHLYEGPIEITESLREVSYPNLHQLSKRRQHLLVWILLIRLSWYVMPGIYPEGRAAARRRAADVVDEILTQGDGDVLVVSHAALMMELRKELRRRGYRGPQFGTAANGRLYVFEPQGG
jgi:broad specificity phosphatase PhoE